MGNRIFIHLHDHTDTDRINDVLEQAGLDLQFITEADNQAWLDDINTNPDSPQAHCKPADRDFTMAELHEHFGLWTVVNQLDVDISFSRTAPETICQMCDILTDPAILPQIQSISRPDELIEYTARAATPEQMDRYTVLLALDPRRKTPPEERRTPPTGGSLLAKTRSAEVWLLFGNVEAPTFLLDDTYENPEDNVRYRDAEGRFYVLVPLLRFSSHAHKDVNRYYDLLVNQGVKVDFRLFAVNLYHMHLAHWRETLDAETEETRMPEADALAMLESEIRRLGIREGYGGCRLGRGGIIEYQGRHEKEEYGNASYAGTSLHRFYGWQIARIRDLQWAAA